MDDFVILDAAAHLAASKRKTYRDNVMAMFRSIASFLRENRLTTHDIPIGADFPYETFRLMRSDLTDDGYMVIKAGLDRWMGGVVTGKWSSDDTSALARELAKCRGFTREHGL